MSNSKLNPHAVEFIPSGTVYFGHVNKKKPVDRVEVPAHRNHKLMPELYSKDGRRRVDAEAPMLSATEWQCLRGEDLYVYEDREYQKKLCAKLLRDFQAHYEKQARLEREEAERDAQAAFVEARKREQEEVNIQ